MLEKKEKFDFILSEKSKRMNFGRGISISQENEMLVGGNWLPAGTDKQFLGRSQPVPVPVPVEKQVNQAGRTNWQSLLGFPGENDTQNVNLVDLGGGLNQTLYNWDGNFSEKNRLINHIASSYNQTFVNGDTSSYSQALADVDPSIYNQALANGGTTSYSQALALASGGTIYYPGLGYGGSGPYSQAVANASDGAYSRLLGNGSADGETAIYNQAMHDDGDVDLSGYSLQDLLRLASAGPVDRNSVRAGNGSPVPMQSASETRGRSIHDANRPLAPKVPASEEERDGNFHVANGSLAQQTNTCEAPEIGLQNATGGRVSNSHSQFGINWEEGNSIDMLLGKENQCIGSSMWKNGNSLLQIPECKWLYSFLLTC